MNNILKVVNDNKCSGCKLCENVCNQSAIVFNKSDTFLPTIDSSKCNGCGLCLKMCEMKDKLPYTSHKSCSQFSKKYAVVTNNATKSQSGGVFFSLAKKTIKQGGIVYGVSTRKNMPIYSRACSIKAINKMRGSKYTQPDTNNIYKSVECDLTKGKIVLFSGTPCVVSALKTYLSLKNVCIDYLYCVDIVCHGITDKFFYMHFLNYLSKNNKKIRNIVFRNKKYGWGSSTFTCFIGHRFYESNFFYKLFYSSYMLVQKCFSCNFSNLNRVGDLTIGDCWGIDKIADYSFYKNGSSFVMVNTDKGDSLFNCIQKNSIELPPRFPLQHNLERPTPKPKDIINFMKDFKKYGFDYSVYKYCIIKDASIHERVYSLFSLPFRILHKHLHHLLTKKSIHSYLL